MEYNLDFSGDENSWFDLWHTHIDWNGKGYESPESRKAYLYKLLSTFIEFKSELRNYPHEFQIWIIINEEDSSEDGIYIHTKNPNEDNFPIKINPIYNYQSKNTIISEFIEETNLKFATVMYEDNIYYYLYDAVFGEPLE